MIPTVIAVFRLAIAEARRAPEIARALDSIGRETTRAALRSIMQHASARDLVEGRPTLMAEQFAGLLSGALLIGLLQVVEPPTARDLARRARDATAAFLTLYPGRPRPISPVARTRIP